jgi:maspardin
MWSGANHYSDSQFIQISCACPVCFFRDTSHGNNWEFRQLGDKQKAEAVVFIPGIRETVSSYFQLMPTLANRGYRVITISYLDCQNYNQFSEGFNELMVHLQVRVIHFCGNDFGGFLALQISSAPKKTFLTKSITLVNSYSKPPQASRSSFKLFNFLSAKSELIKDLETYNVYQRMSESLLFIIHEIETLSNSVTQSRLELKASRPFPFCIQIPDEAICVIETNDRFIHYPDDCNPMNIFPKAKLSLMKSGGDWPHLEAPADLLSYLFVHLQKWGETIAEAEAEAEAAN